MSENTGTTVSTPFIFLRIKNHRDAGAKRALMTSQLSGLLKIATKLFRNYGAVKSIYTSSGELVTSISQVIPSETYYVSSVEPDMQTINDNKASNTKETPRKHENKSAPNAFNKLFGNDTTFNEELRRKQEEQRLAEEEEARRQEEEKRRRREEAEAQRKRKIAEEKRRREEEEAERRRQLEEEERIRREEEERLLEEEYRRHEEEEEQRRFEEEQRRAEEQKKKQNKQRKMRNGNEEEDEFYGQQDAGYDADEDGQQRYADDDFEEEYYEDAEEEIANEQAKPMKSNNRVANKSANKQAAKRQSAKQEVQEEEEYSYYYDEEEEDIPEDKPVANQKKQQQKQQKQEKQQKQKEAAKPVEEEKPKKTQKQQQKKEVAKTVEEDDEYYSEYYEEEEDVPEEKPKQAKKEPAKRGQTKIPTKQAPKACPQKSFANKAVEDSEYYYDDEEEENKNEEEELEKRVKIVDEDFDFDDVSFSADEGEKIQSVITKLKESQSNDNFIFIDDAPRENNLAMIISDLLGGGDGDLEFVIDETTSKFNDKVGSFIKNSPEYEVTQENYWATKNFQSIKNLFTQSYDDIKMKNEMMRNARDLIIKHRTLIGTEACYAMKLAVVGPRHSGKSTFLTVLAHEIIADVVASGCWKSTFLFFANLQEIQGQCQTLNGLFNTIAGITIDMLSTQSPVFAQYSKTLKSYFESVIKNRKSCPMFSHSSKIYTAQPAFANRITKIARMVWSIYNDEESMDAFLSVTFMLPRMIATAAGFQRTFFVLDNFEYSEFEMAPSETFNTQANTTVNISEYWKFLLHSSNFVISCEEQGFFFDILQPISESGIDLNHGIEFVSTIDMIEDNSNNEEKEEEDDEDNENAAVLSVKIDGIRKPFKLSYSECGGCYAFVGQWIDLMDEIDEYEQISEQDELEKEEKRLEVVAQVQQFMDDLYFAPQSSRNKFDDDDTPSILVTDVSRTMKTSQ